MKRFACHYLYVSIDGCYSKYVVQINENNIVDKYFPLKEEISATQWVGGVIVLSPFKDLTIHLGETFSSLLQRIVTEVEEPLYAWHITNFDFIEKEFTSTSKLTLLS